MSRLPRGEVIDPTESAIVHVMSRTVRQYYFLGFDPLTGKNCDHRKEWIERLLERFAGLFGIDLLSYSILSNHYHIVFRSRPDIVSDWDDTEVAKRWLSICPTRRCQRRNCEPNEAELDTIRKCPQLLADTRERLANVSWWMRLLNQRVAQRANSESNESGKFWQERFELTRIDDEESLLACAAYVELNPIRAAMAETLEESDYTSVQNRIRSDLEFLESHDSCDDAVSSQASRRDGFLAKLEIDELSDPIGSQASSSGRRCSDKGFLPISRLEFYELLDWSARQLKPGKRGKTPDDAPPILVRLGFSCEEWIRLISEFDQIFSHVAARLDRIELSRGRMSGRRLPVPAIAKQVLAA
ncbi:transposase [Rhodopirellula sp. MGV]|uniref:transposase n=1 Tax=Rhodopirellula sp. MGV TaxID=2023130 RepID=UPI000B9692DF|nr:transposase [Rhodopirellula sp. MGV]OYP34357.1 hypothetical protein CGZ80_14940 [Rhodopirellula sp. MGV]PNY35241.1 hypothetical protein C2E31_19040 [Rhodopirellula baltica]